MSSTKNYIMSVSDIKDDSPRTESRETSEEEFEIPQKQGEKRKDTRDRDLAIRKNRADKTKVQARFG
jgi:hypothetical protein